MLNRMIKMPLSLFYGNLDNFLAVSSIAFMSAILRMFKNKNTPGVLIMVNGLKILMFIYECLMLYPNILLNLYIKKFKNLYVIRQAILANPFCPLLCLDLLQYKIDKGLLKDKY